METQTQITTPTFARTRHLPPPGTLVRAPGGSFARYQAIDMCAALDMPALRTAFDTIPADPYFDAAHGERCKAIGRFVVRGERVEATAHGPLYQSTDHNPVHGGIVRHYPELPPGIATSETLRRILTVFSRRALLESGQEILVQLQRIRCLGGRAQPAIEGWHQDGTKQIALLVVSRTNVVGGISKLSLDGGKTVVLERTLRAGQMLVFDDELFWHTATPVDPIDLSSPSQRDIVILTYPSCRAPIA